MLTNEYVILKNTKSSNYVSTQQVVGLSDKVEAYVREITTFRNKRHEFIDFPSTRDYSNYVPTQTLSTLKVGLRNWWIRAWKRRNNSSHKTKKKKNKRKREKRDE